MRKLYQILAFTILIIFVNIYSYSQSKKEIENPFLYYKFLPYYDGFKNDSDLAKKYKKNKIKSVSEFRKNFISGKQDKEVFWEKREYNGDGFLVKITNPDIKIYRGPTSFDDEHNRIDSTTYNYDTLNNTITYKCWVRKNPETTIYKFDELGRLIYIEVKRDSVTNSIQIIKYDIEKSRVFTVNSNEYYKEFGSIYIIENNRITKTLNYNNKDTATSEIYFYINNWLTIKEYENDYQLRTITRYYNNGKFYKEIREIDDEDIIVEEYFYEKDYIKNISYKREIESSYSLFTKVSKTILYLNENKLPVRERTKWQGFSEYEIRFQYEYYD